MTMWAYTLFDDYACDSGHIADFANVLFTNPIPYKYAPYAPLKRRKTAPPEKPREVWLKLPTQPMAMEVPE